MATKKKASRKKLPSCKVEGCESPAVKYGYCEACRGQLKRRKKRPTAEVEPVDISGNAYEFTTDDDVKSVEAQLEASDAQVAEETLGLRMTPGECLELRALDAEVRNSIQGMRLVDYEIRDIEIKFQQSKQQKLQQRALVENMLAQKKHQYEALIDAIAERYSLDKKQMTYDVDTGLLRDLRPVEDIPFERATTPLSVN